MYRNGKVYFPISIPKHGEGSSALISHEELDRIPRRYRWILMILLKLPNPGFPNFVLKRLPEIEGLFWAVVVPAFLIAYFFFCFWLVLFLSLFVIFPFNVVFGLFIPATIFVLFLRIQLERAIHWWRNVQSPTKEWDVVKAAEELVEIFRKQQAEASDAD